MIPELYSTTFLLSVQDLRHFKWMNLTLPMHWQTTMKGDSNVSSSSKQILHSFPDYTLIGAIMAFLFGFRFGLFAINKFVKVEVLLWLCPRLSVIVTCCRSNASSTVWFTGVTFTLVFDRSIFSSLVSNSTTLNWTLPNRTTSFCLRWAFWSSKYLTTSQRF